MNKYDITEHMQMKFVEIFEEVLDGKIENLILNLNEFIRFVICYSFLLFKRYFTKCVAERTATFLHREERQVHRTTTRSGINRNRSTTIRRGIRASAIPEW